jgi:hypothetical protein
MTVRDVWPPAVNEDEKKEFVNSLDEKSKEIVDDKSEEIFEDKSEAILAELREKCPGDDFAIGPRCECPFSENARRDGGQSDRTFSNFATEEVLNRGLSNEYRVRPILWFFPLVAALLLVPLMQVVFKATDELRSLPTNSMTSNERSQTVGFQTNDDGVTSSRDLVDTSIRGAKELPATALANLPAPNDVTERADTRDSVRANPAKSTRQRHRPSRVAIYHRSRGAWHVPKLNLKFNAIY